VVWTSLEGLIAFTAGLLAAHGWRRLVLVYRPGRLAAHRYQPAHARTPPPAVPPGTARPAAVSATGGAERPRPRTAPLAPELERASQWGDRDFGGGWQEPAAPAPSSATAIWAAAERDAARIQQQASGQAAKIRATAEADAAELQALIKTLTDDLANVTGYLTEAFGIPAQRASTPVHPPVRKPAASPAAAPSASPTERPATSPAAKPATRPATPATRPADTPATQPAKAATRPRQYAAARGIAIIIAALIGLVAVAGSTEIVLHGLGFFVFRSPGTGATRSDGLQEIPGARPAGRAESASPCIPAVLLRAEGTQPMSGRPLSPNKSVPASPPTPTDDCHG
jgi:hypothetical protein